MLFENRKKVGENILSIIKDNGYTKSSFARITDISRPTLDKLINGEIDNKATYTTHIQKILESQKVSETELLEYKKNMIMTLFLYLHFQITLLNIMKESKKPRECLCY